jgi:hypothetical protein
LGFDGRVAVRCAGFEDRRNSFAGLVTFSRRFFEQGFALRAGGDGKTNDAWLSQTVDGPQTRHTGPPEAVLESGGGLLRAGMIFVQECRGLCVI